MLKMVLVYGVAAVLCLRQAEAQSSKDCKARILTSVRDDIGNMLEAGAIIPMNIERRDKGSEAFCSTGGSCVPLAVNGRRTIKLLNCKIGPAISDSDFRLVPDARLIGPQAAATLQLFQDVTRKLIAFGFSNASAGSLSSIYVDDPHSREGRLVVKTLGGSRSALETLKKSNP